MEQNAQAADKRNTAQSTIAHYRLDFQQKGNRYYYVLRHCPACETKQMVAMLIDLNNVYLPDNEMEKMIYRFLVPAGGVHYIAFVNCHTRNRQEIKRALKAGDVKLYSNTAFFADAEAARRWLAGQGVNG